MNRRFAVNALAAIVLLIMLVLMARSMNYTPARVPKPAAAETAEGATAGDAPVAGTTAADEVAVGGVSVGGADGTALGTTPDLGAAAAQVRISHVGFRSEGQFSQHFAKHGGEFGNISPDGYLLLAQALRDCPVGGDVLEARRPDGVICRYDRATGAFIAYNVDLTIRTFFRPNEGEAYYLRQLGLEH